MSLRVLMIAQTNYPSDPRVRREAEALVARGDKVDVICPQTDTVGVQRFIGGVRLFPTGSLTYKRELSPIDYVRRDLGFMLRAAVKAFRLHLRMRYDLVHVHTMPDYLVAAAILPRMMNARVILDVHDLVPELYASKFRVTDRSRIIRLTKLVERRCVSFADHALAVHRPHLDALVRHGNARSRFTIVMNTPDPRFFRRRSSTPGRGRGFELVYHGTISRRHGLETAIRAVGIARQSCPDVRLTIMGEGDDIARLVSIVQQLDLADAVEIHAGMRPIEELEPVLSCASVGVVPIVDDSFTRYMLPVKLLEYVALGLPVICTRTRTIETYFDDTMVSFFRSGDEGDMAARIIELHADQAFARERIQSADAFFDRHSWPRERERYYAVVDGLVNERHGPPASGDHRQRAAANEGAYG